VLFSPLNTKVRRGHWTSYPTEHGPLPALMTFHPNFLLQHPENKGHAFADLKAFRARMDEL
jgi:uracil-DNA glycosylase